jgi:hypothetical protein
MRLFRVVLVIVALGLCAEVVVAADGQRAPAPVAISVDTAPRLPLPSEPPATSIARTALVGSAAFVVVAVAVLVGFVRWRERMRRQSTASASPPVPFSRAFSHRM